MGTTRPIVIAGFMGCGKSAVARELARRLNLTVVDLDERITAQERRTPAQIIIEDSESSFRSIETEVLSDVLGANQETVIALGGGVWIEDINRNLIEQHNCLTVWLDAPFELCWDRISASSEERPLGKTRQQAQALYDKRREVYELADIHVVVKTGETPDLLASRIEAQLDRDESV